MKIVIIDYGLGNVGSIRNMLKKIGAEGTMSSNVSDIERAEKLILPGVRRRSKRLGRYQDHIQFGG